MRDAKKEQEKELSDLFKAVITAPKVLVCDLRNSQLAFGEDPKSVLCPFFKAGRCDKGDRCKYSHDLNLNTRKSAKKDIHTDHRDEKAQETNADWDRDKLEEVLRQKEGKRPQTTTKIVCKYFLDAIEKECYGWFWQCPNGPEYKKVSSLITSCKYRHALPEGYVYKSRAEREAEAAMREADRAQDKNMMRLENIEYLVSLRRRYRDTKRTNSQKEKEEIEKASEKKKVSSKEARLLSGRALFIFNPNLFVDDEGAAENKEYEVVDPSKCSWMESQVVEEEENAKEGKEEVVNIAEAAEAAAAAAEAAGEGEAEEEEVKISLTVFADEDLEDLPSDDEDEGETQKEKEPPSQLTTQPSQSNDTSVCYEMYEQ